MARLVLDIERQKLQRTLKGLMKKQKQTYESLAAELGVSPATIKRRLNGADLSLQQLIEISSALGASFYELVEHSKAEGGAVHEFTEAQEEILGADPRHIHVFRLLLMGQNFAELRAGAGLTEFALRKVLRKFEEVGLVRLLAEDRLSLQVGFPFRWRAQGRLDKVYTTRILQGILGRIRKDQGGAGLHQKFEIALSPDLYAAFCEDLRAVYRKYQGFSQALLTARVGAEQITSGILFVDRFSCWDG